MDNTDIIQLLNKELPIKLADKISYAQIQEQLASYLNNLIKNDFEKLLAYLYRIDVSETKLKLLLQQFPEEDAGHIIALLIIERQQQKIKSREQFRRQDNNIEEEEKW